MAGRAIWRGVVRFGDVAVPVKLYAAVEDRSVRFRLLHDADRVPVEQRMVNPETGSVVPYAEANRGYVTDEGTLVVLEPDDLDAIKPSGSRDIEILQFLPPGAIDHRWYRRPYYLGPDGPEEPYAALVEALERQSREGLARWTMHNQDYVGALRIHRGYPLLVTLRHEEQVVPTDTLPVPTGPELDERVLGLARELIELLEAPFEPEAYADEYRARIMALIEAKAQGNEIEIERAREKPRYGDLSRALRASLKRESLRV